MQVRNIIINAQSQNISSASNYIAFDKRDSAYPFLPILVQRSVRVHDEKDFKKNEILSSTGILILITIDVPHTEFLRNLSNMSNHATCIIRNVYRSTTSATMIGVFRDALPNADSTEKLFCYWMCSKIHLIIASWYYQRKA